MIIMSFYPKGGGRIFTLQAARSWKVHFVLRGLANRFHKIFALMISEDSAKSQGLMSAFPVVPLFDEEDEEEKIP